MENSENRPKVFIEWRLKADQVFCFYGRIKKEKGKISFFDVESTEDKAHKYGTSAVFQIYREDYTFKIKESRIIDGMWTTISIQTLNV